MITKDDIRRKCQEYPGLQGFSKVIQSREFKEEELEAIDFVIETWLSMRMSMTHLNDVLIAKLETWLASIKDTD